MHETPIKYLVADDNRLFRSTLVGLLSVFTELELVAEADNGVTALTLVRQHHPQVVLLDCSLPELDGVHVTRAILTEAPDTAICLLTMDEPQHDLVSAADAGVRGFLPKDSAIEVVHRAIAALATGSTALPPSLAFQLLGPGEHFSPSPTPSSNRFDALTAREQAVVYGIAQQWRNRQIAEHLGISESAVKAHVRKVLKKLNVQNRRQVATFVQQLGLQTSISAA